GQVGIEPKSGKLHEDFDSQLKQVMKNIDGLLEAASTNRNKIIKTTIFLTNLGDFDKVNKAYIEFFEAPFPARSTVEVSALPKGALVEIEVIAAK
ncbi:MAG: RidA family protein, partial [Bacteriovoracaceae bacterium]|nr:RidA family protein [Bacteriovoracaceae bacterium]